MSFKCPQHVRRISACPKLFQDMSQACSKHDQNTVMASHNWEPRVIKRFLLITSPIKLSQVPLSLRSKKYIRTCRPGSSQEHRAQQHRIALPDVQSTILGPSAAQDARLLVCDVASHFGVLTPKHYPKSIPKRTRKKHRKLLKFRMIPTLK